MSEETDTTHEMRLTMMYLADQVAPIHEFVLGEVAYYVRQGFTEEQARAMAAAEFTTVFGLRIHNSATRPEDDEGPHPEG